MDPRADDRQRGTLASRLERGRGRRHAATKHRHSRLRGGVPRRGGAAGHLVLQNDTTRGLTHMTEYSPFYSPKCVEGVFCEVRDGTRGRSCPPRSVLHTVRKDTYGGTTCTMCASARKGEGDGHTPIHWPATSRRG